MLHLHWLLCHQGLVIDSSRFLGVQLQQRIPIGSQETLVVVVWSVVLPCKAHLRAWAARVQRVWAQGKRKNRNYSIPDPINHKGMSYTLVLKSIQFAALHPAVKHATPPPPEGSIYYLSERDLSFYILYILYHDYTNTALKQPNQLCRSKCGEY